MSVVYKQVLMTGYPQEVSGKPIHFAAQRGKPTVWFIPIGEKWEILVVGTGVFDNRIDSAHHIGTVVMFDDNLVLHAFARPV